jgi:polyhydroxyalkanoate synthase
LRPAPRATRAELPAETGRALIPLETAAPPGGESTLDTVFRSAFARLNGGVSSIGLWLAFADWAAHLATAPGKQADVMRRAWARSVQWQTFAVQAAFRPLGHVPLIVEPEPHDKRFLAPEWQQFPFSVLSQAFLLQQQAVDDATSGVPGVQPRHERMVNFAMRQMLDVFSPSNALMSNPEVLARTIEEGGVNLIRGAINAYEDAVRHLLGDRPHGLDAFRPGETVAVTPGKVVYRNKLIELIQYEPATEAVHPEPVLIVPAWIMKYYILDLSPENSLVRYLVSQGFTVFMVSWKNPDASYRDVGLDDDRTLGVMAAIDEIWRITRGAKVHAAGYCLGGTLLSIAVAAMGRDRDERLETLSLFATQTDFAEAGELQLFVGESEVSFLDDMMKESGVLEGRQMAATFQLLRSNDLIWSRWRHDYLMGQRRPPFDLMAWNADVTRMPARMHSEYLRKLYLENQLAESKYLVDGRPVTLHDIRIPVFVVATELDHIAPWQSVYKIHLLTHTALTFLLTSGGHNAGIVSEPGHRSRSYRVRMSEAGARYIDPGTWERTTPRRDGSWWPEWVRWLKNRSGEEIPARSRLHGILDAPGQYVRA